MASSISPPRLMVAAPQTMVSSPEQRKFDGTEGGNGAGWLSPRNSPPPPLLPAAEPVRPKFDSKKRHRVASASTVPPALVPSQMVNDQNENQDRNRDHASPEDPAVRLLSNGDCRFVAGHQTIAGTVDGSGGPEACTFAKKTKIERQSNEENDENNSKNGIDIENDGQGKSTEDCLQIEDQLPHIGKIDEEEFDCDIDDGEANCSHNRSDFNTDPANNFLSNPLESSSNSPPVVDPSVQSPQIQQQQQHKKKSKRRRWVLSRKPKRTKNPQNPKPKTSNAKTTPRAQLSCSVASKNSKTGDRASSEGTSPPPDPRESLRVALEPAVHASVFTPVEKRSTKNSGSGQSSSKSGTSFPSNFMDWEENEEDEENECRQTSMSNNSEMSQLDQNILEKLLPHLHKSLTDAVFGSGSSTMTSSGAMTSSSTDVSDWSIDDVVRFVRLIPSTAANTLAEKFKDELIDGEALLLLTRHDLIRRLHIKLGSALKIYYSIKCLEKRQKNYSNLVTNLC